MKNEYLEWLTGRKQMYPVREQEYVLYLAEKTSPLESTIKTLVENITELERDAAYAASMVGTVSIPAWVKLNREIQDKKIVDLEEKLVLRTNQMRALVVEDDELRREE